MIETNLMAISEDGRLFIEGSVAVRIEVANPFDGVRVIGQVTEFLASVDRANPCFPPPPHPADQGVEPDLFKQPRGA